jgi:hypothetical protein
VGFIIAVLAWGAAVITAFQVPGSPFARLSGIVQRLSETQTGAAAFEEFLSLGREMNWVASTVFPLVAAIALVLASRVWLELTIKESAIVVLAFAGFVLIWGWDSPTGFDALALAVFGCVVILSSRFRAMAKSA